MSINESFLPYRVAAHYLSDCLKKAGMEFPTVGVICGSGLSELSKALEGKTLRRVPSVAKTDYLTVNEPWNFSYHSHHLFLLALFSRSITASSTRTFRDFQLIVRWQVTRERSSLDLWVASQPAAFEDVFTVTRAMT